MKWDNMAVLGSPLVLPICIRITGMNRPAFIEFCNPVKKPIKLQDNEKTMKRKTSEKSHFISTK